MDGCVERARLKERFVCYPELVEGCAGVSAISAYVIA